MAREHEHEIFDNARGKSIGKAWWNPDTQQIECSNNATLRLVFSNNSLSNASDEHLISNLSRTFRAGYVTARKVK